MKSRFQISGLVIAMAALLMTFAAACGRTDREPYPSNVIIVVVDALRADHLGCYGYEHETTPEIDRLAGNALVFSNAYSNATFTFPSTASMFTSTLPVVHRITWSEQHQEKIRRLSNEYLLLTEVFHDAGFRTGLLTFPGWVSPTANYMQGVDVRVESERSDRDLLERARDFISGSAEGRFFLYLHFIEMHDYYHPEHLFAGVDPNDTDLSEALLALREATNRESYTALARDLRTRLTETDLDHLKDVYDKRLRETDRVIGELVHHLDAEGLLEDTVLAVTSDHGEQFLEHGRLVHGSDAFYNEVLRIPFIVSSPKLFTGTRWATTPITSIDFGPMLLELSGLEIPPVFQGESLLQRLDEERVVFACDEQTWKAISAEWSYIVSLEKGREELYHLVSDPGETVNLVAQRPEVVRLMREQAERMYLASKEHEYLAIDPDEIVMPEDQRDALKALGYVD